MPYTTPKGGPRYAVPVRREETAHWSGGLRVRGPSAGHTGFYGHHPNVYQRSITAEEARRDIGEGGLTHFVAANDKLIAKYAPAWILNETWPPPLRSVAIAPRQPQA